jgi:hypothetical protein
MFLRSLSRRLSRSLSGGSFAGDDEDAAASAASAAVVAAAPRGPPPWELLAAVEVGDCEAAAEALERGADLAHRGQVRE